MDFTDIKNKSVEELKQLVADKREELRHLRFQAHSRELKQVGQLAIVKKTIARALMVLNEKNKNI
ncbi:MAG: 50S ribosomal protein L29 [Candidatus Magasanikbacteria bacterium]